MKGILEFNLPEEGDEHKLAVHAQDHQSALWDFSQYLRDKLKYQELSDETYKVYEEVRERFYQILSENNVEL